VGGIEQLRAGNRLHEVGRAVQDVAERPATRGARVRGHAIAPHARAAPGAELLAGRLADAEDRDVFAVEPMVNAGSAETRVWTTTGAW